jgi:hypothetical protein
MPPKKSKPTDKWAACLEAELSQIDQPPEGGRTFTQIQKLRKELGMTYGPGKVHTWLNSEIAAGRMIRVDVSLKQEHGRKERKVYYIIK